MEDPGLVAILNRSTGLTAGYSCLQQLERPSGSGVGIIGGTNVPRQRNEAVSTLLKVPKFKWLLFIDDDQVYPADALMRLLSRRQPIISAVITGKYPPYQPWVFFEENKTLRRAEGKELVGDRVLPVASVGTGFLLIRRKVFEAIPEPWFEFGAVAGTDGTGEDILFGLKARQAGFGLFVDTGLKIGHLTVATAMLDEDGQGILTHRMFMRKEYIK